MPDDTVFVPVDCEHLVQFLEDAAKHLAGAGTGVVVDFASIGRVDTRAIAALEQLSSAAAAKTEKVALRSVNVDVYKALKLARVASHFSFVP